MKVPFLSLEPIHRELRTQLSAAMERVLASGTYVGGQEVEAFEDEFCGFTSARHCVSVGNGLDALKLALLAVGVRPGDEVIVPSHTFIATWLAASQCGATPVPVEPVAGGFLMDPDRVEAAITPLTRAIVPVHLYGAPAALEKILLIAKRHGLAVVEDAAQAHGAVSGRRTIGAHGDAVAWSFYPGKNLGALGDAGAVTTDNAAIAEQVRLLRNYGSAVKYEHREIGFNSRLDAIQAAVLRVKVRHLKRWNDRRAELAARYIEELSDFGIAMPVADPLARAVWHLFVVRHAKRDQLQRMLTDFSVETLIHYPAPPHRQHAYQPLAVSQRWHLPLADGLARQVLSLPMGPHLSDDQAGLCIEAVKQATSRLEG